MRCWWYSEVKCYYCKDTDDMKDNFVHVNCRLFCTWENFASSKDTLLSIDQDKEEAGSSPNTCSQAISAQVKFHIIKGVVANCLKVNINCGSIHMHSLLDSDRQVTFICQNYLKKELLPLLSPLMREKTKATHVLCLTTTNIGELPVSMYDEINIDCVVIPNIVAIRVQNGGVLISKDPMIYSMQNIMWHIWNSG